MTLTFDYFDRIDGMKTLTLEDKDIVCVVPSEYDNCVDIYYLKGGKPQCAVTYRSSMRRYWDILKGERRVHPMFAFVGGHIIFNPLYLEKIQADNDSTMLEFKVNYLPDRHDRSVEEKIVSNIPSNNYRACRDVLRQWAGHGIGSCYAKGRPLNSSYGFDVSCHISMITFGSFANYASSPHESQALAPADYPEDGEYLTT